MNSIPVKDIIILGSRRPVDPAKVEILAESIKTIGLINPITVTTDYTLIAGAHRLEAFKLLERDEIPVIILDLAGLQKELAEIDENLIRSDYTKIEMIMYLARKKEIYEELNPQTKKGGARTPKGKKQNEDPALCYAKSVERQAGISERTVQKSVKIAKGLAKTTVEKIKDTPIGDNIEEIDALSKMPKQQQVKLVEKVLSGQADSIREAIKPSPIAAPKTQAQIRKEKAEQLDKAVNALLDLMPSSKTRNTIKETMENYPQFDTQAEVISRALDYFAEKWKP